MKLLGLFTNTSSFTKSLVISAETGSHRLDRFSVSTTLLSRAYTGLLVLLGGDHEGGYKDAVTTQGGTSAVQNRFGLQ